MITRQLEAVINERMFKGKAIIVVGARQVGKSTLFGQVVSKRTESVLELNCDEAEVRSLLQGANLSQLRLLIGNNKILLIDEAQRIAGIGMVLKRITDNFKDVQLLVTGSSAFELQDKLNEPLTGRKFEYTLFPISTAELYANQGLVATRQQLESRLIYGSYPDVINHSADARELLMNISESYLYKDILSMEMLRKPVLLNKLLVALALQISSGVSYNELAQLCGTDSKTVEKYIDLLEKCYVVFRLSALSRNIRTELKKGKKVYFYDNGIRNAVLQNFSPANLRADMGALWENFIISERIKINHYSLRYAKSYFWRTTTQQEIDYVEEADGSFVAFEMKWNPRRKDTPLPDNFMSAYNVAQKAVITPHNYLDFLL